MCLSIACMSQSLLALESSQHDHLLSITIILITITIIIITIIISALVPSLGCPTASLAPHLDFTVRGRGNLSLQP